MQLLLESLDPNIQDWRKSYKKKIKHYVNKGLERTDAYFEEKSIYSLQDH
jgi:hypothetical protein